MVTKTKKEKVVAKKKAVVKSKPKVSKSVKPAPVKSISGSTVRSKPKTAAEKIVKATKARRKAVATVSVEAPVAKPDVAAPVAKPVAAVPVEPKPAVKPMPEGAQLKSAPISEVKPAIRTQEKAPLPVIEKPADKEPPAPVVVKPELKDLELKLPITVKDLSIKLQEKPSVIIKMLMNMRMMTGINQFLDETVVAAILEKFGFKIKHALDAEGLALSLHQQDDKSQDLRLRSPIVTLMGHVDHGKTSLLDAIRKTKVAENEHGGITQHIGAYRVHLPHGDITFLDTPGHEAFTAMRARGASLTDIVILVVAADDGVMPQTREAIDHARAAGVSIIVAINKIDKPQSEPDRVKKQLAELGLNPEEWGGKTITVGVSAKTGEGIDGLLEMILLEAQMLELKANPDRPAKGVVVEAKMSKGKGPVATLLIQNGTLHLNENIVVGNCFGKIRAMFNHRGQAVTDAPPTYPVEILGLSGIPAAGETFFVIADERQAKELVQMRQEKEKQLQVKTVKRVSLEELHTQIKEGKIKELKLVIKADVQGSLEAIKDVLGKIVHEELKLEIIHEGVGNINSSDVILAVASNALVLGFNVVQDDLAKELSSKEGVDVKIYNIIYELGNDIKSALEGMLEPKLKKVFMGRVDVRKVFKLSRSGLVAGCFVSKGKIIRQASISVLRNGEVVFEGKLSNLKRFKDDVREVAEGFECGITLNGFDGMQEGDVIEAYNVEKIARTID